MDNFVLSFVVYTFPHRSTTCRRGIEKQIPRAPVATEFHRAGEGTMANDASIHECSIPEQFTKVDTKHRDSESRGVGETRCVECAAWTQVARMQLVCERF